VCGTERKRTPSQHTLCIPHTLRTRESVRECAEYRECVERVCASFLFSVCVESVLRGCGSLNLQVSFAKETYERDGILQKCVLRGCVLPLCSTHSLYSTHTPYLSRSRTLCGIESVCSAHTRIQSVCGRDTFYCAFSLFCAHSLYSAHTLYFSRSHIYTHMRTRTHTNVSLFHTIRKGQVYCDFT